MDDKVKPIQITDPLSNASIYYAKQQELLERQVVALEAIGNSIECMANASERRQEYLEFVEGHLEELVALRREHDIDPDDLPGLIDMVKHAVFNETEKTDP